MRQCLRYGFFLDLPCPVLLSSGERPARNQACGMEQERGGREVAADPWELQLRLWILETLETQGGAAQASVVAEMVSRLLAKLDVHLDKLFMDTLTKYGVSPVEGEAFRSDFLAWAKAEGQVEVRSSWREDLERVANQLVVEGYLKKDSPEGTWEISRKGMVYLMRGDLIDQIRQARRIV